MEVLEALLIALLLLGTVVFLLSFQHPTEQDSQTRVDLANNAGDVLRILEAGSSPDSSNANRLAYDLVETIQGSSALTTQLHKYFPGAEWDLQVRNIVGGAYPVTASSKPGDQTVTVDQLFRPGWRYLYAVPRLTHHDGTDPLALQALPVVNGARWEPQRELVRIDATYTDGSTTRTATEYAALAQPPDGGPTVSLLQVDAAGDPALATASLDLSNLVANPLCSGLVTTVCTFQVNVTESAGSPLRPGATLQVEVPRGWTFQGFGTNPDWTTSGPGVGTVGPFTVHATLATRLTSASAPLKLQLTPPTSPTEPFQILEAQLGHGTLGHAELVVPLTGATASEPRRVYASVPYPTAPGSSATWGVAFANGLTSVTLESLRVTSISGSNLFASVTPVNAPAGTWTVASDGSSFRWTGSTTVGTGAAENLVFRVGATSTTTWTPDVSGTRVWPHVSFSNGYGTNLTRMGPAPGFYEAFIPPASYVATVDQGDGYPSQPSGDHIANVTLQVPGQGVDLQRNATYDTASSPSSGVLTALDAAYGNASVGATPGATVPGTYVTVQAQLKSFLTQLAQQGATNVQVQARLYAPPSLGTHPLASWNGTVGGQALASVVSGTAADVNGDGTVDAVLGATDQRVYALAVSGSTEQGSPLWNLKLPGTPTILATGVNGAGDTLVLAGDAGGNVTAVDGPAGTTAWTSTVTGSVWALHGVNTDGVPGDDATWILSQDGNTTRWTLVGTSGVVLQSGSLAGTGVASTTLGSKLAIATSDDTLEVVTTSGTVLWQTTASSAVHRLAAAGTSKLLVLHDQSVTTRSGSTGGILGSTSLGLTGNDVVSASTALDATGDGVADLAIATSQDHLLVFDGAAGTVAWESSINRVPATVNTGSSQPGDCTAATEGGPSAAVYAMNECVTVSTGSPFALAEQRTLLAPQVLAVVPTKGLAGTNLVVAYAGQDAATGQVAVVVDAWDASSGANAWANPRQVSYSAGWPNVLLGNVNASWAGAGTAQGDLWAVDGAQGITSATTAATQTQDQFRYRIALPQGTFLGTHLFLVRVNWTDVAGNAESTNLVTTIDVLAPGGTYPPDDPVYDALLTVWYPDWR